MDLSQLQDALSSKSFGKVAEICDELMLEVAPGGLAFQDEWPYPIHLLGHIYVNDLNFFFFEFVRLFWGDFSNSARFLWKSMPVGVKESQPEAAAVWKIGQCLWTRDYAGVYEAIRGYEWSPEVLSFVTAFSESYTKRMFQLLISAYSTISVADAAHFLGMKEDEAITYVLQHGWTVDSSSRMLIVKKPRIVTEQKLEPSKLQRLTEYVFHLEH